MATDSRTFCLYKKQGENGISYCKNELSLNLNLPTTFKRCLECHDRDIDGKLRLIGMISTPRSKKWNIRLIFEKLEMKRLINHHLKMKGDFFIENVEFDWNNSRILTCQASFHERSLTFKIRLDLKYPFEPPRCSDFSFEEFTGRHAALQFGAEGDFDMFRHACLGEIEKRWNHDGTMSIAQYLQLFSYYTAIEHFNQRI